MATFLQIFFWMEVGVAGLSERASRRYNASYTYSYAQYTDITKILSKQYFHLREKKGKSPPRTYCATRANMEFIPSYATSTTGRCQGWHHFWMYCILAHGWGDTTMIFLWSIFTRRFYPSCAAIYTGPTLYTVISFVLEQRRFLQEFHTLSIFSFQPQRICDRQCRAVRPMHELLELSPQHGSVDGSGIARAEGSLCSEPSQPHAEGNVGSPTLVYLIMLFFHCWPCFLGC